MMRTKAGRALLALRENPRVASTFGINVRAGHAVRLRRVRRVRRPRRRPASPHNDTFVSPEVWNFNLALVFVIMTVVGGLRSRAGVVIGGAFFALHAVPHRQDPRLEDGLAAIPAPADLTPELAPLRHRAAAAAAHADPASRAASASRSGPISAGWPATGSTPTTAG